MTHRSFGFSALLALPLFVGCATVSDQAPAELKAAEKSLDAAKAHDVEDLMPRAMESAQRKFDLAVDKSGPEAITLANESKQISDSAVTLVNDMRSMDANSGSYVSASARGARTAELEAALTAEKARTGELEAKLGQLTTENTNLANKPAVQVESIPADFRVGKAMAYFGSGSTVLAAKYRPEIRELGQLLKANKDLEVTLEGFADPRGSAALNQRLAEARLQAVAKELKAQGVEDSRVKLVTVGATADSQAAKGARQGELQLDRKVTATITAVGH